MTDPLHAYPRAARTIAILSLFLELVDQIAALPEGSRAPSEAKLLASMPMLSVARVFDSLATARDEMNQLAPAVMAGP